MEAGAPREDTLERDVLPEDFVPFALFAYGSLKRGLLYHDRFCTGTIHAEEATVRGELYDLPFGFPALVVPPEDVRATGTADPIRDAATERRLGASEVVPVSDGPRVFGELYVFDDPEERLPALDRLEGFDPAGQSLYRRVLLPVALPESVTLAWAYVMGGPSGVHLPGGRWPA